MLTKYFTMELVTPGPSLNYFETKSQILGWLETGSLLCLLVSYGYKCDQYTQLLVHV